MKNNNKVYLVGGGIASLSAAFFLLKDGKMAGKDIIIFENSKKIGGSLDGEKKLNEDFYIIRGHRLMEESVYEATFNLLSQLPSLENPQQNLKEEVLDFNQKVKIFAKARFILRGVIVDAYSLSLSGRDRLNLLYLLFKTEKSIQTLRINEYFSVDFFKSNFWLEFCTIFAFQPWHSLIEFRRYILNIFHLIDFLDTLSCGVSTPYCQYDSIIVPLMDYLKKRQVNFKKNCLVEDLDFIKDGKASRVKKIYYQEQKIKKEIVLNFEDAVIVTLGSMTANSSFGSHEKAPELKKDLPSPAWSFWEKISQKQTDFGNPTVFNDHINRSKWESFSITFNNPLFFDLMEKLTGNKAGTDGGSTFKNSNWNLSITLPYQPHFKNQPKNLQVCWGYGMTPDVKGNFVKKKMSECSGEDILAELCGHLKFEKYQKQIQASAICIPYMMPYITSQFSLRKKGDRPLVIPKSVKNLAFIGQFCEVPNGIVFTIEYSIRSAQIAVYSLLNIKKKIPPIYKGYYNLKNIYKAIKTVFR